MKISLCVGTGLALLCGGWTVAYADMGFRCGTHLVEIGAPEAELLEHCGPPTSRKGSVLIYDRGPEEDTVHVHLGADGNINRIDYAPQ